MPNGTPTAKRNDLMMTAYLPYCEKFITADWVQRKELSEIALEAKIGCEILSFEEFDQSFRQSPSDWTKLLNDSWRSCGKKVDNVIHRVFVETMKEEVLTFHYLSSEESLVVLICLLCSLSTRNHREIRCRPS